MVTATEATKDYGFRIKGTPSDKGIVEAVVSVFDILDSDSEVVDRGAFAGTIAQAKSRGVFPPGVAHHDWKQPVARTLDMWEGEDGLHVVGQFNLETQRGRESFSDIKNGLITEYSFGFAVTDEEMKEQVRHIKAVEMFEWSPVLVGANRMTRTVGVKADDKQPPASQDMPGMMRQLRRMHGRMGDMMASMQAMMDGQSGAEGDEEKAVWDTAYINDLPDSAFAVILPGGKKDDGGKTTPRSLRKLPHHSDGGEIDMPHLRNALSREPQTDMGPDMHSRAKSHLMRHAREQGMETSGHREDDLNGHAHGSDEEAIGPEGVGGGDWREEAGLKIAAAEYGIER